MDKKKILVVDDKYGIRLLLSEVFKNEGYEAFLAEEGYQAIEIAHEKKPDLIILDVNLPGMGGVEILKNIRMFDNDMKIIIMTAYGGVDMLGEVSKLGVLKHFIKPFNIGDLKVYIREVFQKELEIRN